MQFLRVISSVLYGFTDNYGNNHNYTPLKFVELQKITSLIFQFIIQDWSSKHEEVMELKQEPTKLELSREELPTGQGGTPKCGESETEVSCVCTRISPQHW